MSTRQNPVRSVRNKPTPKQNVFTVEKVLSKRLTRSGSEEFLIKWQGFPESESSWEPRENLQCDSMIDAFEKKQKKEKQTRKRRLSPSPSPFEEPSATEQWSGKQLRNIIGITKAPGDLHFLCKFTDDSVHLLPSKDIYNRFPNHVIRFYESRLALQGVREDKDFRDQQ